MFDRARVVDRIERAIDHDPTCPVCGAPTTVVEDDGTLVLRCTATLDPEGVIARLDAAMRPHVAEPILDLTDRAAA